MRLIHVVAGLLALASGAVALCAVKGAKLHRRSGTVFVYTMLVMSATGVVMATVKTDVIPATVIAGVLTCYLVLTAPLTVRRAARGSRWSSAVALLAALAVGLASVGLGFKALGGPTRDVHPPAAIYFVFGGVSLLAALGDLRLLRQGRLEGPHRLARHLWRMCFALWIAVGSLFLGLPQLFPEPLRNSGLLAIPPLLVLLVMLYWLLRVSLGRARWSAPRERVVDPLRLGL